jgi:hypothetical protein
MTLLLAGLLLGSASLYAAMWATDKAMPLKPINTQFDRGIQR